MFFVTRKKYKEALEDQKELYEDKIRDLNRDVSMLKTDNRIVNSTLNRFSELEENPNVKKDWNIKNAKERQRFRQNCYMVMKRIEELIDEAEIDVRSITIMFSDEVIASLEYIKADIIQITEKVMEKYRAKGYKVSWQEDIGKKRAGVKLSW